ncbi:MAG: hypothetical protein PF488_01095 [Patescibacteria group bacterium]|jgi:hypothetical protein|nr:hypothetical protein [Patescibacteria group bacterium]
MNTREKLERAGWEFEDNFGVHELYKRNKDKVLYDIQHDITAVCNKNDERFFYPNTVQLDLILEKEGCRNQKKQKTNN